MLLHLLFGLSVAVGLSAAERGLLFDFPLSQTPTRLNIRVDLELVDFAQNRAASYRPSYDNFLSLFSWSEVEDCMNKRDHFSVVIPGAAGYTGDIPIHFVHHRSMNVSAIPLLLLHGWSSTHLEWDKIIDPLAQFFHLITPDLPGYGFSPAATESGMDARTMGAAYDVLMKELGYGTYGVVGTDVGYFVSSWMMSDVPDSIIGHFLDFMLVPPTQDDIDRCSGNQTTPEENAYLGSFIAFESDHFVYSAVQAQKALVLSLSMGDSPVGFAGWLWDLRYAGSALHPTFTLWVQAPYGAVRSYLETLIPKSGGVDFPSYKVPTGLVEWGNQHGPFPELASFPLAPKRCLPDS
ncbi:Alpha/Beta hydrolase protein [Aspergillus pseudoustus]|uniref:Alpha/Beta hydrolase protein n=1 Tax=Aspergillus pseudoustus TaxID=1810923 RepID=A0ABR4ISH7_9EURO